MVRLDTYAPTRVESLLGRQCRSREFDKLRRLRTNFAVIQTLAEAFRQRPVRRSIGRVYGGASLLKCSESWS